MKRWNDENIEKELKISKKQYKTERYDYLRSNFNVINYCVDLERYTNKLKKENKILRENAENNDKVVDKVNWDNRLLKQALIDIREYIKSDKATVGYDYYDNIKYFRDEYCADNILKIIDKVLGDDRNENK